MRPRNLVQSREKPAYRAAVVAHPETLAYELGPQGISAVLTAKNGRVAPGFVTGSARYSSEIRRFAGIFSIPGLAADSHSVGA